VHIRIRSIDGASSLWINGLTWDGSSAVPSLILESKWVSFDRELPINSAAVDQFIGQLSSLGEAERGSAILQEEYGEQTLSLHAADAGAVEVRCTFIERSDQEIRVQCSFRASWRSLYELREACIQACSCVLPS